MTSSYCSPLSAAIIFIIGYSLAIKMALLRSGKKRVTPITDTIIYPRFFSFSTARAHLCLNFLVPKCYQMPAGV